MTIPSQRKYDAQHAENVAKYARKVRKAYLESIKEVAKLSVGLSTNPNDEFYFRNNPEVSKKVDTLLKELNSSVYGTTVEGINSEWDYAVEKNNELAQYVFGEDVANLPNSYRAKIFSNNAKARQNFVNRKINGLGLSDRVWNNTKQFKTNLELALEAGIGRGNSAATIAKNITQYLNEPDKLFRKVRESKALTEAQTDLTSLRKSKASKKAIDKQKKIVDKLKSSAELRLSKAAEAYNPGQGRYRSSYKNALRLTANETNFSYEGSQTEKRKQQDFIVGVEIRVSPSHNTSDDKGGICCSCLQGKYPKNFDFTYKWHVNCKCMSLNILKTRDELDSDTDKILAGGEPNTKSKNAVRGLPTTYNTYLTDNKKTYANWKNPPRTFDINKDLPKQRKVTVKPKTPAPIIQTNTPKDLIGYGVKGDTTLNPTFLNELPDNLKFTFSTKEGTQLHPFEHRINISKDKRWKSSEWYRSSAVYHEGGHAIDVSNGFSKVGTKYGDVVESSFNKHKRVYTKDNYALGEAVDRRLTEELKRVRRTKDVSGYTNLGVEDVIEQITSTQDTLQALTLRYGQGHSADYFKNSYFRKLEYVAHAFENKYANNQVFKKYMPDIYEDTIKLIDGLQK